MSIRARMAALLAVTLAALIIGIPMLYAYKETNGKLQGIEAGAFELG